MLARANRVVRGADFRNVVRRGRRVTTGSAVYYRVIRGSGDPARFGFIVSRAVGGAVERNLLRRRYRALSRELVDAGAHGADVVIRAFPAAGELTWSELGDDVHGVLDPVFAIGPERAR